MTPITSITGEIMLLAVSSPERTMSELEVRTYAGYELRNKLLAIPGVAQVSVIGGELPEYQVMVRQSMVSFSSIVRVPPNAGCEFLNLISFRSF